jgi:glutamyl-tRNA reductase
MLSAAFQHATSTGKRVRASGLGGGYASLGAAAIDMAGRMMGQLKGKSALIIGAGKVGELAGQALRQRGIASIAVTSRTFARALQLAGTIEARAIVFNELSTALSSCHLMLTATISPHWVVSHHTVAEAMNGREEPLLIIDLAVPRDVEPSAAAIPGVSLVNVDDLVQQMGLAPPQPVKGIGQAESIVAAGVVGFGKWLLERQAAPTITTLYQRAEEMCQSELERARRQLAGMSAEEWQTVQRLTRAISHKLLHPAVARLITEAAEGNGHKYDRAVNHLFSMGGDNHGKAL